jgi:hypothetical protein
MSMDDIKPYEDYRGIKIYVYEDVETAARGVQFDWYGRLQEAVEEEYESDTLENKLNAAHGAIDLLLTMVAKGAVDERDGTFKKD